MSVLIYTTPNCPACDATKTWLTKRGIAYEAKRLAESMTVMELATAKGFTAAPVVIAGPESWCGFRPDLIDALPPEFKPVERV